MLVAQDVHRCVIHGCRCYPCIMQEIKRRIALGWAAFSKAANIMKSRKAGARWLSGLERWLALATGRCETGSNPTA